MSDQPSGSHTRRLQPILPHQNDRAPLKTTTVSLKPRLNPVLAACTPCRKHKTKCSGERPTCRRCVQRRTLCVYTTRPGETPSQALSRNHDAMQDCVSVHKELFELLKDLPEQDAQDAFQQIRAGTDAVTILNHIKTGDILLQMAVVPETRFRYEFPYRSEMPAHLTSDSPYLESLIYESSGLYSQAQKSHGSKLATSFLFDRLGSRDYYSYLQPFHAAHLVEPWLSDIKISCWTTVCDDDVLMRDLLEAFLRSDYQFTAAFQKDRFLEDMAAQRQEFCSSLLVNIVLAYSCVCHRRFSNHAKYWEPSSLVNRFAMEAKRLWELTARDASITTIQAGMLFTVFHNLCGLDEVGQQYRMQVVRLAHQLHLFDKNLDEDNDRMRNGRAFTAWAVYNFETLTAYAFRHAPLLTKPPNWPLPDPMEDSSWYGEFWVKYPLNQNVTPTFFGHTLRARCQFRVIMNNLCHMAYSTSHPGLTYDEAWEFHTRLRGWSDNLSEPLRPEMIVLPGHLQLHMYYYRLLLTIYEPLLDTPIHQLPHEQQDQPPKQVVAKAKKELQILVRLYYLRHGFEAMDFFLVVPLMLIAFDCENDIGEEVSETQLETLRSTLILVARGLYDQCQYHYLATALFRLVRGRMRPQEVHLFSSSMKMDDGDIDINSELKQAVLSQWPVTIIRNKDDMESHVLANLVQDYIRLIVQ